MTEDRGQNNYCYRVAPVLEPVCRRHKMSQASRFPRCHRVKTVLGRCEKNQNIAGANARLHTHREKRRRKASCDFVTPVQEPGLPNRSAILILLAYG